MREYQVERSQDVLTVRRTRAWTVTTLAGAVFLLAFMVWMGRDELADLPHEWVDALMFLLVLAFMMFVLYMMIFWGRRLVFDRQQERFVMDGRRICALSDLTWVRLEVTYSNPSFPKSGTFVTLSLRTEQGREIKIKSVPEQSRQHDDLRQLGLVMAEFIGANSNIAESSAAGVFS